jgi:Flp pilus assembly protein TadB
MVVVTWWRPGTPGIRPGSDGAGASTQRGRGRLPAGADLATYAIAACAGIASFIVTGWPVAAPIGALAAYGLPRLLRQNSTTTSIAIVEAVATWTEMLQGTLAASAGLSQAIIATADLSPMPIRGATGRLAAEIRAGVEPRAALLRFADDVGDPSADRVVCALLLAFSSRAQRLGDLLSALAESTREEVALRLRVETSRASVRSGVRTVVVFSVAFAGMLALVARSYLAPYGTSTGQLVLGLVGVLYAAGLTSMVALARPPRAVRLLGDEVQVR